MTRVTGRHPGILLGPAEGPKALEVPHLLAAVSYQHPVPSRASPAWPATHLRAWCLRLDDGELHPEWCELEY